MRNDEGACDSIRCAFLDPANTGDASTPQSITAGASTIPGTGDPAEDISDLLVAFQGDLENAVFITSAFAASPISNTDNPNCGSRGGELKGCPLITSSRVPDGLVCLVDPSGIAVANGDILLKASAQADIAMLNGDSISEGSSMVSMWQSNSVAIRAEQTLDWRVMRDSAVACITDAARAAPSQAT